jgi:hypothetical protein
LMFWLQILLIVFWVTPKEKKVYSR